ncbi:hypothetical protein [Patulibacter americanus]|uniref:hypothetical protein n=1 Tax=Patulibacter americanus TaxID=588672 RepID=UPI0003B68832|nr:hypothetical protein [Patulibacter americanus]
MTAVRVRAALDDTQLEQVLAGLRGQPDVAAVTTTGDGFEVELAGYALDAAEARTVELLRMIEPEAGVERGALRTESHPDASPGGINDETA